MPTTQTDLQKGAAIQVCPHTPLWRSGARFGEVVATRRDTVLVRLDNGKRDWLNISLVLEA